MHAPSKVPCIMARGRGLCPVISWSGACCLPFPRGASKRPLRRAVVRAEGLVSAWRGSAASVSQGVLLWPSKCEIIVNGDKGINGKI